MSDFTDSDIERLAATLVERLAPEVAARLKAVAGPEMDGLCDHAEALRILGVSRSSLYRLVDAGHVKRLKFGRSNRFDRAELYAVVDKMRRGEIGLRKVAGK